MVVRHLNRIRSRFATLPTRDLGQLAKPSPDSSRRQRPKESYGVLVSEAEWRTRVKLAAADRPVAHFDMKELTGYHISCCVPDEPEHFLINPCGTLYQDVTASSLIKFDLQGNATRKEALQRTRPYSRRAGRLRVEISCRSARPRCVLARRLP